MEYISSIFSLVLFLGAILSLSWGCYIIRLNLESKVNRIFLIICISLSIWSLGFAMANSSNSLETALFWRRFAAIGWTSIFSIMVHFLLLITDEKGASKGGKYLFLIHTPAIINMYIFAFSNKMVMLQYNLVEIHYGWTNIAVNNGWDFFYYLYFSLYTIVSLVIVWKWKARIKEEMKIRQAELIFGTILSAAILGSLTDLVSNTFLMKPLPQMAPLFILLPLWSMYYSARYHGVMNKEETYKNEIIVTEEDKRNIFKNLARAFYIAAILAFVSEYIPFMNEKDSFKFPLLKGLSLASVGIALRIIQNIKKESIKENLTIIVLVSSIPMALFQYLKYGSITVWAFPMVIIISSIVFSRLTLLISTTVVAIITQGLIWIFRPEAIVVVDKYDYILRIGMFIVAFFTGLYINKIYVSKIEENDNQIAFQKMVSDITFDFLSFNEENLDEKVDNLLAKIGRFFNVDRTYLFTINHNNDTMTYSNEWCNLGINEELGTIEGIPLDVFPWWIDQLNKKNLVYIEDVDLMPKEAREEQEQLHRQNVKSLVSVPVMGEGKVHAFIGVDSVLGTKK